MPKVCPLGATQKILKLQSWRAANVYCQRVTYLAKKTVTTWASGRCPAWGVWPVVPKLNTFSQGLARQNPSVNFKKKPHSEEEEKEEEEKEEEKKKEEEEEETATALDGNEVSCESFDMDAYDHSNHGLESEIF